jgi:hypothetical protein
MRHQHLLPCGIPRDWTDAINGQWNARSLVWHAWTTKSVSRATRNVQGPAQRQTRSPARPGRCPTVFSVEGETRDPLPSGCHDSAPNRGTRRDRGGSERDSFSLVIPRRCRPRSRFAKGFSFEQQRIQFSAPPLSIQNCSLIPRSGTGNGSANWRTSFTICGNASQLRSRFRAGDPGSTEVSKVASLFESLNAGLSFPQASAPFIIELGERTDRRTRGRRSSLSDGGFPDRGPLCAYGAFAAGVCFGFDSGVLTFGAPVGVCSSGAEEGSGNGSESSSGSGGASGN